MCGNYTQQDFIDDENSYKRVIVAKDQNGNQGVLVHDTDDTSMIIFDQNADVTSGWINPDEATQQFNERFPFRETPFTLEEIVVDGKTLPAWFALSHENEKVTEASDPAGHAHPTPSDGSKYFELAFFLSMTQAERHELFTTSLAYKISKSGPSSLLGLLAGQGE